MMSKFVMQLKRDGEIDEMEGKTVEVKSFAEATFVLVEELVHTADENWSVEIIDEWLKQASRSPWPWTDPAQPNVSVVKTDQECEYTFSYEV